MEKHYLHGSFWVTLQGRALVYPGPKVKTQNLTHSFKNLHHTNKTKYSIWFWSQKLLNLESRDLPWSLASHRDTILFWEICSFGHYPFLQAEPLIEDESIGCMVTQALSETEWIDSMPWEVAPYPIMQNVTWYPRKPLSSRIYGLGLNSSLPQWESIR